MTKLRAGLIGLGMMGRHHARVLNSLDGVDFVGAVDPGGDQFHATRGHQLLGSVEELIANKVDYCVVAVPTAFHEGIALKLADARIHTLVEKPLAHDVASAARIAEAFEKADLIGGVGHIERYNAALQQARTRIAHGDLGEVFQVATRRQGPFPGRIADVGVVKDLGSHDIDLTSWITQQTYRAVSAFVSHRSGRPHEDLVSVTGDLSRGTVINHLVNWLSPLKERTIIVTGEKGTFIADTLKADLTFYENSSVATTWDEISRFRGVAEGNVLRFAFPKPEPLLMEHEAFRDAVAGRYSDVVTMRQGLETLRVAEACLMSAKTGDTQLL